MKSYRSAWFSGLALGALAFVSLVGCGGIVTKGGGEGSSGGGGAGGNGTGTGSSTITGGSGGGVQCDPGACPTTAIAMSHAQYAAATGEDPNGGLLTDTQYLQYGAGTQTPTCGAPFGSTACGGWTVSLTLPTSDLTPGTYPFADMDVDIYFTASYPEGNNSCAGMGGVGFMDGQIEIVSVTDTTVDFEVSGVLESGDGFSINGAFSASRCPAQ